MLEQVTNNEKLSSVNCKPIYPSGREGLKSQDLINKYFVETFYPDRFLTYLFVGDDNKSADNIIEFYSSH